MGGDSCGGAVSGWLKSSVSGRGTEPGEDPGELCMGGGSKLPSRMATDGAAVVSSLSSSV